MRIVEAFLKRDPPLGYFGLTFTIFRVVGDELRRLQFEPNDVALQALAKRIHCCPQHIVERS